MRHTVSLLARLYHSRMGFILVVLLFLPVVGTVGYVLIENWNWFDAFYMSIITLTTVGYGEVRPLSLQGRIFTVFYLFFGVGTAFYSLTVIAEKLLRSEVLTQWIINSQLRTMDNHFIVCGYGRTGRRIVAELQQLQRPYIVIDRDRERVFPLQQEGVSVIVGDAATEDTLRRAGIDRAAGLVAALDNDAANVFVVLTARELNERLHIVARADNAETEPKLKRAGANAILSLYEIGAVRMAHMLLQRQFIDSFDLVTGKLALDVSIEEFLVGPDHPMCRRSLDELGFRQSYQAIVLAVKHPNGEIAFPPNPQTVIEPGAIVIVAASGATLQQIHSFFSNSTSSGGFHDR